MPIKWADVRRRRSLDAVMAGLNDHLLWLILCLCCLGVPIAVVLGLLFRRSFLWWCAATLTAFAVVLAVSLAALNKLGFQ
jgi:Flp pilus assembly protein TadB